jgi:hypothetical protein
MIGCSKCLFHGWQQISFDAGATHDPGSNDNDQGYDREQTLTFAPL